MDKSQAKLILGPLSGHAKARLCARLCHELTIIARSSYEIVETAKQCERLRAINEIQHQASGILARLLEEPDFSPDEALASMFFAERPDKYLQQHLMAACDRVSRSFVSQP